MLQYASMWFVTKKLKVIKNIFFIIEIVTVYNNSSVSCHKWKQLLVPVNTVSSVCRARLFYFVLNYR